MFTLTQIFGIIVIHWFADFVIQTDKQAKGKSKNWKDLLSHTFTYSITFFGLLSFLNPLFNIGLTFYFGFYFFLITFICHTITDYFTSRLNSKLFPKFFELKMSNNAYVDNEIIAFPKSKFKLHNFFVSIGFDQVLHYIQLFLTFYFLTK